MVMMEQDAHGDDLFPKYNIKYVCLGNGSHNGLFGKTRPIIFIGI